MLQVMASVFFMNGSMTAVSACGTTSMSLSLIDFHPRIDDALNPRPSSKLASDRAERGMVKCFCVPGKSMNRRSTALISFSRHRARTFAGVMRSARRKRPDQNDEFQPQNDEHEF